MSSLEGALVVVLGVLVLVLVCSAAGMLAGSVVRSHRARSAVPTGLVRAGPPAGEDDPAKAAVRAGGIAAWTRMSGGSG